jgi:hypothetical protein
MLPRVVNGEQKGHHGITLCAVVLKDCLCDTPYTRPPGRGIVPQPNKTLGIVAAGAQREKEEPCLEEGSG